MDKYPDSLEPGNVVVMDCGVQKFRETKWTNRDKVAFKLSGISYVCKGFLPLDELSVPVEKEILNSCWLFFHHCIIVVS